MAAERKWKIEPEEDELSAIRDKYAKSLLEIEVLKKQSKALHDRQKASKPRKSPDYKRSSIFLIIAALIVAARVSLYIVVEGSRPSDFGAVASNISGFAVICMIGLWLWNDIQAEKWLTAGPAIFLTVAIVFCGSIFDPVWLKTGQVGPIEHPIIAGVVLIACLLFAASRVFCLIMAWLLIFVTDPREAFKQ